MALTKGKVLRPSWKKSVTSIGGTTETDRGSETVSTGTSRDPAADFVAGVVAYESSYTDLAASNSALQASRPVLGVVSFRMPYRGSVVGLVFVSNAAKTTGNATFTAYVSGESTSASIAWENPDWGSITFLQGDIPFEANEYVDVRVTSDTFAPTTADVSVTLYCTFEPE